jgi:hypothetical protein
MLTTCADDDMVSTDENNDRALEAVAHYIMMHYEEKGKLKKRKKKYKPKDGQCSLDTGRCHFSDRAETAVTKELHQFNTYEVFEPVAADGLSAEEKKKALPSLIFLNSLTAIEPYMAHRFFGLCSRLITFQIFIR